LPNRYKFQGQEHIDDLDLGWDSFKWRNHQPDIGRFFNVDPLAENYYYNSPYAFSENKVVAHVELEGLESAGYMIKRELEQKAGFLKGKFENGIDKVVSFFSDIWNAPENVRKESTDKKQTGIGINIHGENIGRDNMYVRKPDFNSKNFNLPKSVLDAVSLMTKSLTAPKSADIGESAKNIATAVDKEDKAAKAITPSVVPDDSAVVLIPDTVRGQTVRTATSRETGESKTTIVKKPIDEVTH